MKMVVIGGTGAGTVPLRQSRVSHHHLRHRPGKARAVVREPLGPEGSIVKYEFMRIADSTGSDDYTETSQIIPVRFRGRTGDHLQGQTELSELPGDRHGVSANASKTKPPS